MLKRFMIGFVLGIGTMYWYLHYYENTFADANQWMERSASQYRGDRHHQIVDQATGRPQR
jgi:hypothetical protein